MTLPTSRLDFYLEGSDSLQAPQDTAALEKAKALEAYNKQMEQEARIDNILRLAHEKGEAFKKRQAEVKAANAAIAVLNAKRKRLRTRLWIASAALLSLGAVLYLVTTFLMTGW